MPRKEKKEECCCGDDEWKGKMMMWHCKGHKIGALIFAISVLWILNMVGVIPASVPLWLQALVVLGFVLMRK